MKVFVLDHTNLKIAILNISALMSAVDLTGAEAIHPGYGFLSENSKFADVVSKHGIKFIGPSSKLIAEMGDKIQAKKLQKKMVFQ